MNDMSSKQGATERHDNEPKSVIKPRSRRGFLWLRLGLLALVLIMLGFWSVDWFRTSTLYVHETDARIGADLVAVASETAGRVMERRVEEGASVSAGDMLVRLDASAATLRLAEMQAERDTIAAELARVEVEIDLVRASTDSRLRRDRSRLDEAIAREQSLRHENSFAESNLRRAQSLADKGAMSTASLDRARTDYLKSQQALQQAAAEIATARAQIAESRAAASEVRVKQAELARLRAESAELQARIDGQRVEIAQHTIRSPLAGVVDRTFVKPGEYVTPGQRLMVVHDPTAIWVESNIRETDFGRLKLGQTVRVEVDAYPDEVFQGTIQRLGDAATSQFALLPRLNEAGTFTKVTQRIPVRIALDQHDGRLKPGMMVEVYIDAANRDWKLGSWWEK